MEWDNFRAEVLQCTKCPLKDSRKHIVVGEGPEQAPVMCIGEGPGYYEDIEGRPFVGHSGQLLDKILSVCGFTRSTHVYIANIVKCRPPNNRTPLPEERTSCLPFLLEQIRLVNPFIIILLGATAAKGLLNSDAGITRLRGKWILWQGRWVMPTYHPSALLRNPSLKKDAWEDFKLVIDKYRELVNPLHHSDFH